MSTSLNLTSWNAVVPVILPMGQPTISSIGIASVGVALPVFFYILAMFGLIFPFWMQNFKDDKETFSKSSTGTQLNNDNDLSSGRMMGRASPSMEPYMSVQRAGMYNGPTPRNTSGLGPSAGDGYF